MNFTKNFFLREPILVARDLLGATLTTISSEGKTSGSIVEVEAYGALDEASHSFKGITKRNEVMFAEGGYCYVYLIYGMHYCVNVVTENCGVGSAVLIRALAPLEGIDLMLKRRAVTNRHNLTSGPAKLCEALAITKKLNGQNFLSSNLIQLSKGVNIPESQIQYSSRIGITKAKELPWRVFIKDSEHHSRAKSVL